MQLRRGRQRFTQVGSSASNGGKESRGQKKKCSQRKNALHGPAAYMNFPVTACLDEKAAVWDGSPECQRSRFQRQPDFVGIRWQPQPLPMSIPPAKRAWADKKGQIAGMGPHAALHFHGLSALSLKPPPVQQFKHLAEQPAYLQYSFPFSFAICPLQRL